jgi:hypothetical protein
LIQDEIKNPEQCSGFCFLSDRVNIFCGVALRLFVMIDRMMRLVMIMFVVAMYGLMRFGHRNTGHGEQNNDGQ